MAGVATPVGNRALAARARRARLRKMGPHYRSAVGGRPPRVPYERIAEAFIEAVELELPPVRATATVFGVDRLWLEKRLWEVRQVGWLPKGSSPLPGAGLDRSEWLAKARALLAERRAERSGLLSRAELQASLTRDRVRAARRAARTNRSAERALIAPPPGVVLDRFGLL